MKVLLLYLGSKRISMTEDKSRRMVGLLVPASDDYVVAIAGRNYSPIETRWRHVAGRLNRV